MTVTYTYDNLRRLTQKSYPGGTTETYGYDAAGRLTATANKNIGYGFSYDAAGRLTNVVDRRGYSLDYEYDLLGTRTKTTLQKGTPDEHVIAYGYDGANRPSTITSRAGTFGYSYDDRGRRSSTTYPSGITAAYSYDTLNRLTGLKHAAGTTVVAFANYSGFDKVGNRKSKTTGVGTEAYDYDAVYRLITAATPKGTEKYGNSNKLLPKLMSFLMHNAIHALLAGGSTHSDRTAEGRT